MRRPPLPLAQDDDYGCGICVKANLLYMFSVLDFPDTNWVNQQLNRKHSDSVWSESPVLLLLNHGLSVYSISKFDSHAFLEHGVDYVRRFYHEMWNEEWEEFHTSEVIAHAQARVRKQEAEVARRNLPRYIEPRKPTIDDLTRLVTAGCAVDLAIRDGHDVISHAVLVYDFYHSAGEDFVSIYYPDEDADDTICEMALEDLLEEWDGYWLDAWWRES